jgi:predicted transcriptional regulator/transcriptional regulator with XRE-family HTH domain
MTSQRGPKLFLGHKVKRLRDQKGLTQAALARELEISPSYLNQIESNQRPLTLSVVMRICTFFDVDIHAFAEDEDTRLLADLKDAVADPSFGGAAISMGELRSVTAASPELVRRVLALYQAYQKMHERAASLADSLTEGEISEAAAGPQYPYEEVRDFFYYRNNYFDPLDTAAEALWEEAGFPLGDMLGEMTAYLKTHFDVRVKAVTDDDPQNAMRRFDRDDGTLVLSARLNGPSRTFHLAHQIALLSQRETIEALIDEAGFTSEDARAICRVGLANYFAGALVLPYGPFAKQARALRHDIEQLQSRFGASFEQVCHRLSTLQRPKARGIPFYFVRVDSAGNITKRHSATRFHFARFGGACPLWNVHEAFAQPGKILVQLARMPDEVSYICIARTVSKPGGAYLRPVRRFAVGLGCEAAYAKDIVYAAGLDLSDKQAAVPIGVNCRICERTDCQQRAFPPIGHPISVDVNERLYVPYLFDKQA